MVVVLYSRLISHSAFVAHITETHISFQKCDAGILHFIYHVRIASYCMCFMRYRFNFATIFNWLVYNAYTHLIRWFDEITLVVITCRKLTTRHASQCVFTLFYFFEALLKALKFNQKFPISPLFCCNLIWYKSFFKNALVVWNKKVWKENKKIRSKFGITNNFLYLVKTKVLVFATILSPKRGILLHCCIAYCALIELFLFCKHYISKPVVKKWVDG